MSRKLSSREKLIHNNFVKYGQFAKSYTHKCQLLLPKIEKLQIWRKKGFTSIYEYAAKLAGMSHEKVTDSLRILRKIEKQPALKKVAIAKGLSSIRPVATISTPESQNFWASKAMDMSIHTLEAYVREYKSQNVKPHNCHVTESQQTSTIQIPTKLYNYLYKLKGKQDWETFLKKIIKNSKTKPPPKPKTTTSRHIPNKIKSYVLHKYNYGCAFPNCNKPYQILHHTKRFALQHKHDPEHLVPLCKAHEQLAHLGLIHNEHQNPTTWSIQKFADTSHPKHNIDELVNKFRKPQAHSP